MAPARHPRKAQLHLVTEPHHGPDGLVRAVAQALDGGVDWVQLRHKSGSAASMFALGTMLRPLVEHVGAHLAINDRLDVALTVGAHGVHLAGQSLPVGAAAQLADGRILVGRSVHGQAEALQAAAAGADYLTFGHVFPTTSHPGLPPRGLAELTAIVQAVDLPVLAIGGISLTNLEGVLATGCAGIAVISAILKDADPRSAAQHLRDALDASTQQPRFTFPLSSAQRQPHAAHRQPTAV